MNHSGSRLPLMLFTALLIRDNPTLGLFSVRRFITKCVTVSDRIVKGVFTSLFCDLPPGTTTWPDSGSPGQSEPIHSA